MFFKNALVYRFNREIKFDAAQLEVQLKEFMFTPCGATDKQKFGWVEPMGRLGGEAMTHVGNGNILLTAQRQTKNIPTNNLRKALGERVAKIEAVEGRPLKKQERDAIRDDVIMDMLPRAFEADTYFNLLIMPEMNLIVVDASSFGKAEDVLALLRKTIGSLPVVPVVTSSSPETIMTEWIKTGDTPAGFTALDKIVLSSIVDKGGKATLAQQDLAADEVKNHIEANKVVTRLNVNWQDRIEFTLSDDFSIKTVKWSDDLKDENDDIPREDEIARFDADFTLACGELNAFLPQLFGAFDGLAETAVASKRTFEECVKEDFIVEHARNLVAETRRASVSAIQRKFKIGYNRAARIMEMLEALEIVSAPDRNGNREVLVSDQKEEVENA